MQEDAKIYKICTPNKTAEWPVRWLKKAGFTKTFFIPNSSQIHPKRQEQERINFIEKIKKTKDCYESGVEDNIIME